MKVQGIKVICVLSALLVAEQVLASEALLRDFLANGDTLRAKFEQRVVDETGMTLDSASGTVYLSRPGKFRWNYNGEDSEQGQQLVADGKSIFLYDPDLEQVTQRSMVDAINQVPSLLLVQDGAALDTFFAISDIGLTDGLSWVALKPKSEDAAYQQLILGFDSDALTVIQLIDGLGNETRLKLSQVVTNQSIAADRFKFDLPPGVDLLSE